MEEYEQWTLHPSETDQKTIAIVDNYILCPKWRVKLFLFKKNQPKSYIGILRRFLRSQKKIDGRRIGFERAAWECWAMVCSDSDRRLSWTLGRQSRDNGEEVAKTARFFFLFNNFVGGEGFSFGVINIVIFAEVRCFWIVRRFFAEKVARNTMNDARRLIRKFEQLERNSDVWWSLFPKHKERTRALGRSCVFVSKHWFFASFPAHRRKRGGVAVSSIMSV